MFFYKVVSRVNEMITVQAYNSYLHWFQDDK